MLHHITNFIGSTLTKATCRRVILESLQEKRKIMSFFTRQER